MIKMHENFERGFNQGYTHAQQDFFNNQFNHFSKENLQGKKSVNVEFENHTLIVSKLLSSDIYNSLYNSTKFKNKNQLKNYMESKIIEITCANKKIHFNDFVRAMKFIYYSPSKKPFIEVTVSQQDCIDQMHSS